MTRWLSAGERGTLPRKRADDSRATSAPDRMKQPKIDQYRNVSIVQYDEFVIPIMISAQSDDTGMFVSPFVCNLRIVFVLSDCYSRGVVIFVRKPDKRVFTIAIEETISLLR